VSPLALEGVVAGVGLWTPSAPSAAAWTASSTAASTAAGRQGASAPAEAEPAAAMLGPRLRRRTSLLTRMACEALAQATSAAGSDPGRVVTVFGTAWGEMQTTGSLLVSMVEGDGTLSPAAFNNSVQNAAAGYASIAAANRAPSTTVSAGAATVAMALLEGLLLARDHDGDVVVVVADEPLPAPFAAHETAPLAVAFLLRREGPGPRLTLTRAVGATPPPHLPAPLARNPVAPALALLEVVTGERPACVALEHGDGPVWCAELSA
jgi:hypothetical protein